MRRGDQVLAQVTGFIRRGPDWVDIIPYIETTFIVYPTPDARHCFLDFVPGTTLWPSAKEILDSALELNFKAEDLLNEKEIEQILDEARKKYRPLKRISLIVSIDASYEMNISADKIKATLTLRKGKGAGKSLDLQAIGKAILKAGLQGMDVKKVQTDVLAFYKGSAQELVDYPLVTGQAPGRGKNGEIHYLVDFLAAEEVTRLKQKLEKTLAAPGTTSSSISMATSSDLAISTSVPISTSIASAAFVANSNSTSNSTSVPVPVSAVVKVDFPVKLIESIAYVSQGQKIADLTPATPGQAGRDVYGSIIPAINGENLDLKLCENLQNRPNELVATKTGLLLLARRGETIFASVLEYREAQIQLEISPDNLYCYLSLYPPAGSEPVTLDRLKTELAHRGIKQGIEEALLPRLVAQAQAGQTITRVLIAKGQPPVNKTGSQLVFHCQVAAGKVLYRQQEETGLSRFVKKDELIAEIKNVSQPPLPGWDLTGKVLEPQEENPLKIEAGKNIKRYQAPDGSVKFFALTGGEVYYDGRLLDIKDKLTIEQSLQAGAGLIRFSGSVEVKGDVKAGCRIFSGADISVDGILEEAVLSAEGAIEVKKGVKGQGKAVLRAKRGIITQYVENAILLAVNDIIITQSCLHSRVKCNSKLYLNSGAASLLGGVIKAKKGLETEHLGSKREVKTCISFGQDYLVEDQIEAEEKEIEKLKSIITITDMKMHKLGGDKEVNQQLLTKLRREKFQALKLLEKRSIRLFNLKEKFEEHFPSEIVIRGTLFPGVVFESHGRTYQVKTKKEKLVIFFNAEVGKIQEKLLQ